MNEKRVDDGLEIMYNFSEAEGNLIHDISHNPGNIDLHIEMELNTVWQQGQGLKVIDNTIIKTEESLEELVNILQLKGELTVEAWVKSSDVNQAGPASIISILNENNESIFSLGQTGNQAFYDYAVGFNSSVTGENGTLEIVSEENFVHPGFHHVIFTRDIDGIEKLYINGLENYSGTREGDLSSWDSGIRLVLANEITGNKPWMGTYYLVAIYSKALTYKEVVQNYHAGCGTLQFKSELVDLKPNVHYYISPFVRTDQGVVYGAAESVLIENVRFLNQSDEADTLLLAVFPNPSQGVFTVEFEDTGRSANNAIIQIADQSGQIMFVKEQRLPSDTYYGQETFDLSGILTSRGLYSVILIMGSKYTARKLIII
jgi:hypothetical protein